MFIALLISHVNGKHVALAMQTGDTGMTEIDFFAQNGCPQTEVSPVINRLTALDCDLNSKIGMAYAMADVIFFDGDEARIAARNELFDAIEGAPIRGRLTIEHEFTSPYNMLHWPECPRSYAWIDYDD